MAILGCVSPLVTMTPRSQIASSSIRYIDAVMSSGAPSPRKTTGMRSPLFCGAAVGVLLGVVNGVIDDAGAGEQETRISANTIVENVFVFMIPTFVYKEQTNYRMYDSK